ncbi:MAG: cytochrome c maturation protein CcmE, partial [Candidatus Bathyarchaeia archaeon]
LTTSQVVRDGEAYVNRRVQILGTIVNGSTQIAEDGALIFSLTDGKTTIEVTYRGNPPQNFMEGVQAVAIGTLSSSQNVEASQILVKCPSKYESGSGSLLTEPVFLASLSLGLVAIIYIIMSTVLKKGG